MPSLSPRIIIIALIAAVQLVLVMGGAVWLCRAMESRITHEIRQRLAAEARERAVQLASIIDQSPLTSLEENSDSRQLLQSIIDRMKSSPNSVACIMDNTGRVISHPLWQSDPAVRTLNLATLQLRTQTGHAALVDSGGGGGPDEGVLETATGPQHATVLNLNTIPAKVLILQSETATQQAINHFVNMVNAVAFSIATVVILLSFVATACILRSYDHRLESISHDLSEQVERRSQAILKSRSAVIMGLAKLAESRDDETGRHLERIRSYVRLLGSELAKTHPQVDDELVSIIEETSILHDIGKVGVPDHVLLKPDSLSDAERRIIQRHPCIGGDTLIAVWQQSGKDPYLITACEIIFAHHERWDGTGYPYGLSGDLIPIAARIVALADVYDALTAQRVYKPGMPHEQARDIIIDSAGTHFDPDVVHAFICCEREFKIIADDFASAPPRT